MNEELDSQLSAMFDDELPPAECELLARRLSRDEQLKARWGRYAVMGAVIRAERGVRLNAPLAGRVSAVLLAEPALGAQSARRRAAARAACAGGSRSPPAAARGRRRRRLHPVAARRSRRWPSAALERAARHPRRGSAPVMPASARERGGRPTATSCRGRQAVPAVVVPSTELANYVVAHSMFSSPVARRNLLSAFMTSEPAAAGAEEPPDDAKSAARNSGAAARPDARLGLRGGRWPRTPRRRLGRRPPDTGPRARTSPARLLRRNIRPDAAQWLERMNHALTTRNYDGTFSHWHGGHVEMLRIIHRVQDGSVSERLVSLDGSGREFIRTGANLACYLPDRRTVLVEQRPPQESLVGFPAVNDQTASFYDIREVGPHAPQPPRHPRDHRVAEGRVPLRLPAVDRRFHRDAAEDAAVRCPRTHHRADRVREPHAVSAHRRLRLPAGGLDARASSGCATDGSAAGAGRAGDLAWNALRLPPGFRMTVRSAQVLPGSNQPGGPPGVHRRRRLGLGVRRDADARPARRRRPLSPPPSAPRLPSPPWSTATRSPRWAKCRSPPCSSSPPRSGRRTWCPPASRNADEPRGAPHASCSGTTASCAKRCCAELTVLGARVALPPIEVVDVDADPQLRRRHGLEVPVLLLDGTVVCRQRLDRAELTRLLRGRAAAAPAR